MFWIDVIYLMRYWLWFKIVKNFRVLNIIGSEWMISLSCSILFKLIVDLYVLCLEFINDYLF